MYIIFRKSTNVNSFCLRGYWAFNTDSREVVSFATSQEFDKGYEFAERSTNALELWESHGTVDPDRVAEFVATYISPVRVNV